jgi:hypothetical protein
MYHCEGPSDTLDLEVTKKWQWLVFSLEEKKWIKLCACCFSTAEECEFSEHITTLAWLFWWFYWKVAFGVWKTWCGTKVMKWWQLIIHSLDVRIRRYTTCFRMINFTELYQPWLLGSHSTSCEHTTLQFIYKTPTVSERIKNWCSKGTVFF